MSPPALKPSLETMKNQSNALFTIQLIVSTACCVYEKKREEERLKLIITRRFSVHWKLGLYSQAMGPTRSQIS